MLGRGNLMQSKTDRKIRGTCEFWSENREPMFDQIGNPKINIYDKKQYATDKIIVLRIKTENASKTFHAFLLNILYCCRVYPKELFSIKIPLEFFSLLNTNLVYKLYPLRHQDSCCICLQLLHHSLP